MIIVFVEFIDQLIDYPINQASLFFLCSGFRSLFVLMSVFSYVAFDLSLFVPHLAFFLVPREGRASRLWHFLWIFTCISFITHSHIAIINPSPAELSWTQIYPAFANSVDPDQLASEEANWSGSALFAIQYVNLQQQSRSSNLIGWELEVGHGILIYSAGQGLI